MGMIINENATNRRQSTVSNVQSISDGLSDSGTGRRAKIKLGSSSQYADEDGLSSHLQFIYQSKNCYKNVSENKEIAKVQSLLSTCINSTRKEVETATSRFNCYNTLWAKNKETTLEEFLKDDPKVSEFDFAIKDFLNIEKKINLEENYYDCGPIALFTEFLKIGLLSETKAWRVCYGKACNVRYRTEMEKIFTFAEDLEKRLSRQIKDLDDIRIAMGALKVWIYL